MTEGISGEGRALARRATACAAALLAFTLAGCAGTTAQVTKTTVAAPQEVIRSSVRFQKEYVLFAGDQVEVNVWRNAEVSRTVTIRPDGYISLPLLQEVKAAGLTPRELAQSITKAYSPRLLNPEVTVIPSQVRVPTVYVLGDVKAPGGYPARNAVTAAQALAAAGGALRSGAEYGAAIIRLADDGYLEAIPVGGDYSVTQSAAYVSLAATHMQPDDILFIPETGRSQIFRALSDLLVPYQIYLNYKLIEAIYTPPR